MTRTADPRHTSGSFTVVSLNPTFTPDRTRSTRFKPAAQWANPRTQCSDSPLGLIVARRRRRAINEPSQASPSGCPDCVPRDRAPQRILRVQLQELCAVRCGPSMREHVHPFLVLDSYSTALGLWSYEYTTTCKCKMDIMLYAHLLSLTPTFQVPCPLTPLSHALSSHAPRLRTCVKRLYSSTYTLSIPTATHAHS